MPVWAAVAAHAWIAALMPVWAGVCTLVWAAALMPVWAGVCTLVWAAVPMPVWTAASGRWPLRIRPTATRRGCLSGLVALFFGG